LGLLQDDRVTDEYVGFDGREYLANESPQAKLLTRTSQGELNPDLATSISLTMRRRQIRPYPPGRLRINGDAYPAEAWGTGGTVVASWAHRDRLLQADQLVDSEQPSVGPEPGTTYTVRWYLDGNLTRTQVNVSVATDSYLPPVGSGGKTLRVEIESVRDGFTSWQRLQHTFLYRAQLVTEAGDRIVTEAGEPTINVGGIATFDGGLQYTLAVTTGGDPVVTSEKTGRRWTISWPNLVRLAVADGIDREGT